MVASGYAAPRGQHDPFSYPAESHGAVYDNVPQAKSRAGSNRKNEWEVEAGAAWGNNCDNFDEGYHSPTAECNSADEHQYNSGDEAGGGQNEAEGVDLDEVELEMILRKVKGYRIKKMGEDGNCMFRAVSDQIYGDPEMHDEVRAMCVDYLRAERDHFSQFVTEDFDQYLARKRQDKVYGNNVELQAMSELFNRPIEVYRSSAEPMKIFHEAYDADSATPMRVSYHRGNHYNSVINPDVNTVGEGLGLPGYQAEPRRIEDECEKTVLRESEQAEVEAKLLELALKDSQREQELWEHHQVEQELEELLIRESRADRKSVV